MTMLVARGRLGKSLMILVWLLASVICKERFLHISNYY